MCIRDRLQGVIINDKHIETILRQMLKKIEVKETGDSKLLPGEIIDRIKFSARKSEISDLFSLRASKLINSLKKERPKAAITKSNITTVLLKSNLFIEHSHFKGG